jgi:glycosyltransferase involved in cell wall biosynthesis
MKGGQINMDLSIIIPAFNVEEYISKTLYSLVKQNEKNFEIIIIDDGSKDKTYEIASNILVESEFSNYRIIKKENGGVSSARNKGLLEANGDYVVFLDGDDFVSDDFVYTLITTIKEYKDNEIICWAYNKVDENNLILSNFFDKYNSTQSAFCNDEILRLISNNKLGIWTGSVAYNKKFLTTYKLVYTEGCINGEDQEFIYKCLSRATKVHFINKVLSFYLYRKNSITNSFNINKFDSVNAFIRTYDYIKNIKDQRLTGIVEKIKNDKVINNYLGNLNNCIRYHSKTNITKRDIISNILDKIDTEYPELNKEIKEIMKNYSGDSLRIKLASKLFLLSPLLYGYAFIYLIKFKKKEA